MKQKFLVGIMMIVISISLIACGGAKNGNDGTASSVEGQTNSDTKEESGETQTTISTDQMKEAYLDFLKGNQNMIVKSKNIEGLEDGKEYSYDEMIEAFSEYFEEDFGDCALADGEYAFIDCGADSVPELAVHHMFSLEMDDANMYSVFKYIDGQVYLVNSQYGFYRSFVGINEYGYITYGGSGGATTYYCDYRFVNKDGEEIFLYSENDEMSYSGPYISSYYFPGHEAPAGYPEDIYALDDNYVTCAIYNFKEYEYHEEGEDEEYYKGFFYTFYDEEENYVDPDSEIAKIYKQNGINYYTPEEAKQKIIEHENALGVTDQIRGGDEVDWSHLLSLGVGKYTKVIHGKETLMSWIPGQWILPKESLEDGIEAFYVSIQENGEFEININYTDKYKAPAFISGHLVMDDTDYYSSGFYFYPTNSNSEDFPIKNYLGLYVVDNYIIDSETAKMTLTWELDNALQNYAKPNYLPLEKAFTNEYYDSYRVIYNPSEEYFLNYGYEEEAVTPVKNLSLQETSCKENGIIDEDKWFQMLGISWSQDNYSDEKYVYRLGGEEYYGRKTMLSIYDKASGDLIRTYDFHDFIYAIGYEGNDFVDRSIRYALIEGNTLYVNLYHSTYASSCPSNAYIMAIDMEEGYVKWKSEPLVSNSDNFVLLGDTLITGYGFSAEDHYLCLVNKYSGEVMSKVNVKKSPDYFYYKDNVLYVRTYSYDYEFKVSQQ